MLTQPAPPGRVSSRPRPPSLVLVPGDGELGVHSTRGSTTSRSWRISGTVARMPFSPRPLWTDFRNASAVSVLLARGWRRRRVWGFLVLQHPDPRGEADVVGVL